MIKGVEGVALISVFQNLPINSMILITFWLMKGVISMFKRANVHVIGADGGSSFEMKKKRWRGL